MYIKEYTHQIRSCSFVHQRTIFKHTHTHTHIHTHVYKRIHSPNPILLFFASTHNLPAERTPNEVPLPSSRRAPHSPCPGMYCKCMYVCMYVCMFIPTHVCMFIHMHACMTYTPSPQSDDQYSHTIHAPTTYACMYICMYVCMYIHTSAIGRPI